ncbi:MAG: NOG1 family protein [Candidatus Kariarchaeaceae archaeon]
MGNNPFEGIYRTKIDTTELIDLAFSKAMKAKSSSRKGSRKEFERKIELARINTASKVLRSRLSNVVESFPSLDDLHPFYYELADTLCSVDRLKQALGGIWGVYDSIIGVEEEIRVKLLNEDIYAQHMRKLRKEAFGRFASIIKTIEPHINFLLRSRRILVRLPGFDANTPTVAVAGAPNSGKSSIVRKITSGKPEVAAYPFTTKKLIFGHRKIGFFHVQFCDTPGLLDRPISERNEIELQGITAFKFIADIILFLIDPSLQAMYPIEQQLKILNDIRVYFPQATIVTVISKIDLLSEEEHSEVINKLTELGLKSKHQLSVSAMEEEKLDDLINKIDEIIKEEVISREKFRHLTRTTVSTDFTPLIKEEEDDFFLIDE